MLQPNIILGRLLSHLTKRHKSLQHRLGNINIIWRIMLQHRKEGGKRFPPYIGLPFTAETFESQHCRSSIFDLLASLDLLDELADCLGCCLGGCT